MREQFMPHLNNLQAITAVALSKNGRYSLAVAAKSATGFDGPINNRRTGAPITIAGAFFVPACPFYGGCAWETLGSAGFLLSRSVNLRTAATLIRLTANRGSSSTIGVSPMHALNPSKIRAAAHRAMALAALHANSSLATRLSRYNTHMAKARALEGAGGAQ
ncbi:hypothetical protein [Pseudomonas protegens]|uniref:hypothetical protein n=1 Tax=Pseudomonas protegens TaxID=380021 RepID=UPI0012D8083C|nr:hypothetical protein [Pseudomonas protegens]